MVRSRLKTEIRYPPKGQDRRHVAMGVTALFLVALTLYTLVPLPEAAIVAAQQEPTGQATPGSPTVPPTTLAATETPTIQATPAATETPADVGPTATASATATATPEVVTTPVSPATATPIPSPTATATATPFSPAEPDLGGSSLWGLDQACTGTLAEPENSVDLAFNGAVASCRLSGSEESWTYTSLEDTSAEAIAQVLLEIRVFALGWRDDPVFLEVGDGSEWETVASFEADRPLPEELTILSYDVSDRLATPARVNAAQFRILSGVKGRPDDLTIYLDEVRLAVTEDAAPAIPTPTVQPLPTYTPTPAWQPTVTFTASPGWTPTPPDVPTPTMTPGPVEQLTPTVTLVPSVTPVSSATPLPTPGQVSPTQTVTAPLPVQMPSRILEPVPTPGAQAPLPADPAAAGDPHADYGATTASCGGCHRSHTATGLALRASQTEEGVCFACHGSAGPGTSVQPAFTTYPNSATRFFTHDVSATTGVHRPGEANGAYGGGNRHAECEDCHEPHEARRGPAAAPMIPWEMNAVSGADPVWTATGGPASFSWLPQATREYQVCFKCHSSFTTLPGYLPDGWNGSSFVANGLPKLTYAGAQQVPDSRDMAREFNPYNASFHPVAAPGRNQAIPSGAFVSGWSASSMVYCTDCHTTPASAGQGGGTHGSPLLHLLTGGANYQTANSGNSRYAGTELCFMCHDSADYIGEGPDTNFRRGSDNLHAKHRGEATCYLCHDTHGSEQLHLLNLDTSTLGGARITFLPGYDGQPTNSQTFWQIDPGGTQKTCWISCHGTGHRDKQYQNVGD